MPSHAAYDINKLRRIWLAFLTAMPIYVGVLLLADSGASSSAPSFLAAFTIVLGILAFAQLLFAFLGKETLAGLTGGNYQTYCILRWALLESISVFGLVVRFLGGSMTTALIFLAVSLAMLVIMGPKSGEAAEVQQSVR